jgi:hypothetical protein
VYAFNPESVRGPEYGANVVEAAHIIKHNGNRHFGGLPELLGTKAV